MALTTMNSIDILEGIKMFFDDHDKFCREAPRRSNQTTTTSSNMTDAAKDYWNHIYDTNSKSSLLFKDKCYDEEDRRKISSPSKFLLREGPGSTVKIDTTRI